METRCSVKGTQWRTPGNSTRGGWGGGEEAYLVHLLDVGDHDDDGCVLLPHHAPEVPNRADDGSLSGDVHLLLPTIALRPAKSRLSGPDAVLPGPSPHTQAFPWGVGVAGGSHTGLGPSLEDGSCGFGPPFQGEVTGIGLRTRI